MAVVQAIRQIKVAVNKFENCLWIVLGRRPPPDTYNYAAITTNLSIYDRTPLSTISLKDIIGDSIFWAVPKSRRTVEKRLKRKFGNPEYHWKPYVPKTNILICNACGHNYEAGVLCPHCYNKVKVETQEMQEKITNELGLDPVDKEVVVLYDGENVDKPDEFWQGKRIIEMKKQRPSWFSKNLLQKTTQQPATTADIKPNDLA